MYTTGVWTPPPTVGPGSEVSGLGRGVFDCFGAPRGQRQAGEPALLGPGVRPTVGTDLPQPFHKSWHFSQLPPLWGVLREMSGDSATASRFGDRIASKFETESRPGSRPNHFSRFETKSHPGSRPNRIQVRDRIVSRFETESRSCSRPNRVQVRDRIVFRFETESRPGLRPNRVHVRVQVRDWITSRFDTESRTGWNWVWVRDWIKSGSVRTLQLRDRIW